MWAVPQGCALVPTLTLMAGAAQSATPLVIVGGMPTVVLKSLALDRPSLTLCFAAGCNIRFDRGGLPAVRAVWPSRFLILVSRQMCCVVRATDIRRGITCVYKMRGRCGTQQQVQGRLVVNYVVL